MLALLAPLAERFVTVTAHNPRAMPAQTLAEQDVYKRQVKFFETYFVFFYFCIFFLKMDITFFHFGRIEFQ